MLVEFRYNLKEVFHSSMKIFYKKYPNIGTDFKIIQLYDTKY